MHMMKQISLFAENKKGALHRITSIIADAEIDLYAVITNDSAEFGIVRMIVSDTEKAHQLLSKDYLCHFDTVLAIQVPNAVGSLDRLLQDIKDSNINIHYLYTTFGWQTPEPIMLVKAEEEAELELALQSRGYTLL